MGKVSSKLSALGPGLLFAAAAVGVSHLVQSTRAGARYGLALFALVIVANVVKYPAFRFGTQYAAATGRSLLVGYAKQGRWALVLYFLLTVGTMFTVQAAVTVVTAGLAIAVFGWDLSPVVVSAGLLAVCAAILAVGRYQLLDKTVRVLVAILTIATLVATAAAIPRVDVSTLTLLPAELTAPTIFFIAALVGWMPTAIDISVWQSCWTLARAKDQGGMPRVADATFDFHVGYFGTAILALCFIVMGAGVLHGSGTPLADSAGGFAAQVVQLYTSTLGAWVAPIIGGAAFAVMLSTTITVQDGFPRALSEWWSVYKGDEDSEENRGSYWIALAVVSVGALVVIAVFLSSLKLFVDLATTLSFLTAPALSWLNHRAMHSDEVQGEGRPQPWLTAFSWFGIVVQGSFAIGYLILRYG